MNDSGSWLSNKLWPIVHKATAYLEDPIGTERPLWRDISRWQGVVDFDVMADNDVMGCICRAAHALAKDARIDQYWPALGVSGVRYRSTYQVLWTDLSIQDQADLWFQIQPEPDKDHPIPRVIDLEVDRGDSFAAKAAATWQMSEIVKERDGFRPIIYSRRLLINSWLASWSASDLNDHYWWLAQYLFNRAIEHPGPPTLPQRVQRDRVVLHQTADKKPGFPGEAESSAVDYDRWELGNEIEMHKWISDTWFVESPPPTLEDRVNDLENRVADLETKAHIHDVDSI